MAAIVKIYIELLLSNQKANQLEICLVIRRAIQVHLGLGFIHWFIHWICWSHITWCTVFEYVQLAKTGISMCNRQSDQKLPQR